VIDAEEVFNLVQVRAWSWITNKSHKANFPYFD